MLRRAKPWNKSLSKNLKWGYKKREQSKAVLNMILYLQNFLEILEDFSFGNQYWYKWSLQKDLR